MKKRTDFIIGTILIVTLCFLTIGYASYEAIVSLNSNITLKKPGVISITNISEYSSDLPANSGSLELNNGNIELNYSFSVSQEEKNYSATYMITIANNSPYDYLFSGFNIEPTTTIGGTTEDNATAVLTYEYANLNLENQVNIGETIPTNETKVVAITIHFYIASKKSNTTITIDGSAGVNTTTDNTGNIYGGIFGSPITLDLTDENTPDCFDVNITNTYNTPKTFYFSLTTNSFKLVDRDGKGLGDYTIDAPSENSNSNNQSFELCLIVNEGSIFASNTAKTQLVINPTGLSNFSIGTININVNPDGNVTYDGAPKVGDVTFATVKYNETNSELLTNVSWKRTDSDKIDVEKWYIALYSSYDNQVIETFEIEGNENISNYEFAIPNTTLNSNSFTSTINENSTFYIKVYGKYANTDSGASYCKETSEYCVSSNAISLKYQFTLTYTGNATLSNTTNKTATVYLNNPFTSSVTASNGYALTGMTVVKGTTELTNGQEYNYTLKENSSTNADFTILENIINDDITITVSTSYTDVCLVKGTKIKVVGGYKNIEDIRYDDLLVVYSYELGKEVYEYPIKIEKEGTTDYYQQITFSDGSILKTFGAHGIFSKDANKFVSVLDRDNFDIGTTVIKISDKELKEVKVAKIENVEEKTTYYNISSTRYLNVIANDFLTTDPILPISNIFNFYENIKWGEDRNKYLQTTDFIPYELLKDYFPKHLYDGIRMGEAKYLINQGIINVEEYVNRFNSIEFLPIPTDENGNNQWMITTSYDLENNLKGQYYTEGSFYELPIAKAYDEKEFIGWYNSSDNKFYQSGDLVKVRYGMYFEAIYKNR